MEIPVLMGFLVPGGIKMFSYLYRSYPAEPGVARVGSFPAGSMILTRR